METRPDRTRGLSLGVMWLCVHIRVAGLSRDSRAFLNGANLVREDGTTRAIGSDFHEIRIRSRVAGCTCETMNFIIKEKLHG